MWFRDNEYLDVYALYTPLCLPSSNSTTHTPPLRGLTSTMPHSPVRRNITEADIKLRDLKSARGGAKPWPDSLTRCVVSKVGLTLAVDLNEEVSGVGGCGVCIHRLRCGIYRRLGRWERSGLRDGEELWRIKTKSSLSVSSGTGRDLLLPRETRS